MEAVPVRRVDRTVGGGLRLLREGCRCVRGDRPGRHVSPGPAFAPARLSSSRGCQCHPPDSAAWMSMALEFQLDRRHRGHDHYPRIRT